MPIGTRSRPSICCKTEIASKNNEFASKLFNIVSETGFFNFTAAVQHIKLNFSRFAYRLADNWESYCA